MFPVFSLAATCSAFVLLLVGSGVASAELVKNPEAIARSILTERAALEPVLLSSHVSKSNGVTHLVFQQTSGGVPIKNADILINIARDGAVINIHGEFGATVSGFAGLRVAISHQEALEKSTMLLGEIREEPVAPRKEWFRLPTGNLVMAWILTVRTSADGKIHELVIDAVSGKEISRILLTNGIGTYLVSPLPAMNPDEEPRRLVANPDDVLASPFGWHDTNGVVGAEFTDTRGNNVFAQEDENGDDLNGLRPSGGSALVFNFPPAASPASVTERNSGIVSMFFATNICHDIFYRYGFTEAAGNFQNNNYGRGGSQDDAVQADTEDPTAAGNAQFFTPNDGAPGRMEFGTLIRQSTLNISAPAAVAGMKITQSGTFGGRTGPIGISTKIVAAIDASNTAGPSTTDCCSPPTNSAELAGNIALIDRGGCNFDAKVRNAQNAGAIAVIVVNNAGEDLVTMSGEDQSITIPSVFVRQSDGAAIRAALAETVNATLIVPPDLNFADDTTIVIHEYSHGITTRLTGGRFNNTCLSSLVSGGLGEGWSDYFALALTQKARDSRATVRRIGAYAFPPGLRTFPYSVDRSINPLSYSAVASRNVVHAIGEIWCTVLWDLHWDLVERYHFSPDPYAPFTAGGNNLMLQLVIDALQLQPCSPTFIQARDALLTADVQLTGGANQFVIWNAFARRGIGKTATGGANSSDTAVIQAFDVPNALDIADADLDGSSNLLEAALGSGPLDAGSFPSVEARSVLFEGKKYPALSYRREVGGAGFTYELEVSEDLSAFIPVASVPVSTLLAEPGYEIVTVRSSIVMSERLFLRLRITRRAP